MSVTYHIQIKEAYAFDVIKDLESKNALVMVAGSDKIDVPDWQKEEVRKTIAKYQANPESLKDEKTILELLGDF